MIMNRAFIPTLLVLALVAFAATGAPTEYSRRADKDWTMTRAGEPAAVVAGELERVRTLIESSSAAREIVDSGNPQALAMRETARELYESAASMHDSGSNKKAQEFLDRAKRTLFQAARLADHGAALETKKENDYASRRASIDALLSAHQRISEGKDQGRLHRELVERLRGPLDEAATLATEEQFEAARKLLDTVYLSVKASIENLRGGETLTRSLDFSTPAEEYAYELDRNEALRMLVRVLLEDKTPSGTMKKRIQRKLEESKRLRTEADTLAERRKFERAINKLDESTRAIIRAIRSAGVYVPG